MPKYTRVKTIVEGGRPDRPPVSFWYHFPPDQVKGVAAIDAHLRHLQKYDLDFLKIMNDNGYPRDVEQVARAADLKKLKVHGPDAPEFAAQLEVIRGLARQLDQKILTTTTVFNPWATLRNLTVPPVSRHGPPNLQPVAEPRDRTLTDLLREDRRAVADALAVIGESLRGFAKACIEAGANGIFLSVRDDWVDTSENGQGTYDEMVAPLDRRILEAASPATLNMLHVCGKPLNFRRFASYPNIQVLNWADRAAGPSIADAKGWVDRKVAIAAGVDNLGAMVEGSAKEVYDQARDALQQAGERPIMVAPGCTYAPDKVADENLFAMVEAAHAGWPT